MTDDLIKSGVYINSVSTTTRDGEVLYQVRGYKLGFKTYPDKSWHIWDGSSFNVDEALNWGDYTEESIFLGFSPSMKESFLRGNNKLVPSSAVVTYPTPYFDEPRISYGLEADKVYDACKEGEKRNPTTCWDDSVIHTEVCRDNAWVLTGETCPTKPECTEGDKRAGYVCVAGKWQPAPAVPEPVTPAECTEGDKKAGYICEGGKWVAYTPPVVPPVEPVEPGEPVEPPVVQPVAPPKYLTLAQADERIRAGLPCYIKCTLPILDMLPGIPYTPGMWVLPFCVITAEP